MTTQIKRCTLFLIGNIAVNALYIAVTAAQVGRDPLWSPDNRVQWAGAILVYVAAQILFRIAAMIALAAYNAATGDPENVDREDELDKAINLKSTALTSGIFMAFFFAAIVTQAFALPLFRLFSILFAGMIVSGLIGDGANLTYYRRGY